MTRPSDGSDVALETVADDFKQALKHGDAAMRDNLVVGEHDVACVSLRRTLWGSTRRAMQAQG